LSKHGLTNAVSHTVSRTRTGESRRARSRLFGLGAAALIIAGLATVATTGSAFATGNANVPMTVSPDTGLSNGQSVTISGTGYTNSSIGNVLECNSDAKQPTVAVGAPVNSTISVSCTAASYSHLVTTSATGGLSGTFPVVQGTVGPPCGPAPAVAVCPATDSGGGSPTADAALYPCPPTPAQQAIGDVCQLTYGDSAGDGSVPVNILFGAETAPSSTTTAPPTTAAPVTATTKAPTTTVAPVTGASSGTTTPAAPVAAPTTGTLASTGPGRPVGVVAVIGGVLLILGMLLLLAMLNIPQRAFAGIFDRDGGRKVRPPVAPDSDRPRSFHAMKTASNWVGHLDGVGQRLGHGASAASGGARGLTSRVVSASARTAAWLLGR
jgi:hypothetical protein